MKVLVTGGAGYIGGTAAKRGWQPQIPELDSILAYVWVWHQTLYKK